MNPIGRGLCILSGTIQNIFPFMKLSPAHKAIAIVTGLAITAIGLMPLEATATQSSATTSVDQNVTSTQIAARKRRTKKKRRVMKKSGDSMQGGSMREGSGSMREGSGTMQKP
jgi:hypothetical protein